MDLVFEIGGAPGGILGAAAVGTMTRPLVVESAPDSELLGVRLRPGMARAVLGVPAWTLTDVDAPLGDLWRREPCLAEQLAHAPDLGHRVGVLSRMLVHRLRDPTPPPVVCAAVAAVTRAAGALSLGALAPTLGVSRQHLARPFAEHVSGPPKTFARVMRLRALLRGVRAERMHGRAVTWRRLAAEFGYTDQPHLVHDFKALVGLTPSVWLAGSISPRRE
jgi:AraC-like DNA-binding protein